MKKIISVIGARPQFIKEAMVGSAVRKNKAWQHVVINSGQHYDANMADIFFQNFNMPMAEYTLGIGSGTHGYMTAQALIAIEKVLFSEKPDALLVYGDTNTTLAGALAAAKLKIPIIHIEAGIRMKPADMPEEINRVLTDRIASVMCCCSELGKHNLASEGIYSNVYVTGDVMFDLFCHMQKSFTPQEICQKHSIEANKFIVVTLHRDYNVDIQENVQSILEALVFIQNHLNLNIVWPMHPRTKKMLTQFKLDSLASKLKILPPLGYIDLMSLTSACAFVITDSGGLQKEAYYAQKRSIVIMPDTGWQELIDTGWNILSTTNKQHLLQNIQYIQQPRPYPAHIYGKSNATENIIQSVLECIQ